MRKGVPPTRGDLVPPCSGLPTSEGSRTVLSDKYLVFDSGLDLLLSHSTLPPTASEGHEGPEPLECVSLRKEGLLVPCRGPRDSPHTKRSWELV